MKRKYLACRDKLRTKACSISASSGRIGPDRDVLPLCGLQVVNEIVWVRVDGHVLVAFQCRLLEFDDDARIDVR